MFDKLSNKYKEFETFGFLTQSHDSVAEAVAAGWKSKSIGELL